MFTSLCVVAKYVCCDCRDFMADSIDEGPEVLVLVVRLFPHGAQSYMRSCSDTACLSCKHCERLHAPASTCTSAAVNAHLHAACALTATDLRGHVLHATVQSHNMHACLLTLTSDIQIQRVPNFFCLRGGSTEWQAQ